MKDKIVYVFKQKNNTNSTYWLYKTITEAVDQAYTHFIGGLEPVKVMFNNGIMYDKQELESIFEIRNHFGFLKDTHLLDNERF